MNEKNDVISKECRFAVYNKSNNDYENDTHLVKEILHFRDGTSKPNVILLRNFKRKFWITKKAFQNHQQKKEWEDIDKVNVFETTQRNLISSISRAIGNPQYRGDLRKLCRNPYIYGCDILSTAVIKKTYQLKYPDKVTPYTVAAFDIETDVNRGTDEIIIATLSFKDKVYTVIQKSFVDGQSDVVNRLMVLLNKYLGKYVEKRNIKWEVLLVDAEHQVVTECFKKAHEWMPDFVAIWNINFDLPKCIAALERAGIKPEDVFSDPIVPKEYRHFRYKVGPKQKVTASGLVTPIKPSAQWHTVYCPSSFYFIDAMCAYRHIRIGSPEEPSYSLDSILKKHNLGGKLTFKEADGFVKLEWHQFMQEMYPLEYIIYNVFDCISMEELDEITSDLSITLPLFSGCSDFENFKSQPRRLADTLHYYCLENKKVFGSTSDEMVTALDSKTLSLSGWINI